MKTATILAELLTASISCRRMRRSRILLVLPLAAGCVLIHYWTLAET